jgi:hypothetical protein
VRHPPYIGDKSTRGAAFTVGGDEYIHFWMQFLLPSKK